MTRILNSIGTAFSAAPCNFSWIWFSEETECPKSLIK